VLRTSTMTATAGILCAVTSAFFNGSFAALFKTEEMAVLNISPVVFQLYVSAGVFLSSWIVIPFLKYNPEMLGDMQIGRTFEFSPLGLVGGFLLVLALYGSFQAVDRIGLALGQGIWGGTAMVVSYIWGVVVFHEKPSKIGSSVGGLIMLVLGVAFIAFCDTIRQYVSKKIMRGRIDADVEASIPLRLELDVAASYDDDEAQIIQRDAGVYSRGVSWAFFVGLSGGSILAPLHYVPLSQQGLVSLPSFGVGAILTAPLVYFLHVAFTNEKPKLHLRKALGTGLLSGLLWNIGNVLAIVAIGAIGYGVAYPIFQCAILVSGAWGIHVFHEISNMGAIIVFWIGGFVLVGGGILLGTSQ